MRGRTKRFEIKNGNRRPLSNTEGKGKTCHHVELEGAKTQTNKVDKSCQGNRPRKGKMAPNSGAGEKGGPS